MYKKTRTRDYIYSYMWGNGVVVIIPITTPCWRMLIVKNEERMWLAE